MSDEQERAEPPASDETPTHSPAEPEAKAPAEPPADQAPADHALGQSTTEGPEAAAEPAEGEAREAPAGEPAEGMATEAAVEAAAAGERLPEAAPPAKGEPAEPSPPAPAANYDGLESGLAWFGFERFEPPAPVGCEAQAVEAPRLPKELSAEERRRIHGRAAARRQEVETRKAWYQRIPLGALSMVPILVFLVVYAIIYPPWGGSALPKSREELDEKLLAAQPVANTSEALRQLGVVESAPACWRVLPGDVIMMTRAEANAKIVLAIPSGLAQAEISCDLCVVDRDAGAWGASLAANGIAVLALQAHPTEPGKDWVAGRRPDNKMGGFAHEIKPHVWNTLKLVVDATGTSYYFNGKKLAAIGPRPSTLGKADLTTYNARLLIRNWRVQAPK